MILIIKFVPSPIFQNEVLKEFSRNQTNFEIVYESNNGSLPPEYFRQNLLTISTDKNGVISGKYQIKDYKKVLEEKPIVVSRDQLQRLIKTASQINSEANIDVNSGCTGGSTSSLKISQDNKVLLKTSAYNCAGRSTNDSLERFSAEVEGTLPSSK